MKINKISLVQAIALILIITINRLSIHLPQTILTTCGSAAILNIVFISIITIAFVIIVTKLFKNFPNLDIIDISENLGGKFLKYLVGIVLISYIIFTCAILLRDFAEILKILYYGDTPIIYLIAFFIIVCIISNWLGRKSVVKTNLILTIIMVVSLLISFLAVMPNLTIQRALPVLGYGTYETFISGLSNLFTFNSLLVIYLVPSMLNNPSDFKKASIIATIIASVLVILVTAISLLAFSFSTEIEKISSLYMLLSNNEFGKYFQHPESLFVFTWSLSFMSYVNVCCMFIVNVLKKLTNAKNERPFIVPVAIIILIVALLPKSIMQIRDFGDFTSIYFGTPLTFIALPMILILANIKHKRLHKNNKEDFN